MANRAQCFKKPCIREPGYGDVYHGLCLQCYSEAKQIVKDGKATWEDLAEMGLCVGPSTKSDSFTQAFEEAKKKKENP